MREEAKKYGEDLYLCRFESHGFAGEDYLKVGFDAAIDFQPHMGGLGGFNLIKSFKSRINSLYYKHFQKVFFTMTDDYGEYVKSALQYHVSYKRYPCVCPMWDNSPRRVNMPFYALKNSSPQKYEYWLRETMNSFEPFSREENFVFINAWNEWAEGNHLEPDTKWGRGYLEATKRCVNLQD